MTVKEKSDVMLCAYNLELRIKNILYYIFYLLNNLMHF